MLCHDGCTQYATHLAHVERASLSVFLSGVGASSQPLACLAIAGPSHTSSTSTLRGCRGALDAVGRRRKLSWESNDTDIAMNQVLGQDDIATR